MAGEVERYGKKRGVLGTGEFWSNRPGTKLYLQVDCLISTYSNNGEIYLLRRRPIFLTQIISLIL